MQNQRRCTMTNLSNRVNNVVLSTIMKELIWTTVQDSKRCVLSDCCQASYSGPRQWYWHVTEELTGWKTPWVTVLSNVERTVPSCSLSTRVSGSSTMTFRSRQLIQRDRTFCWTPANRNKPKQLQLKRLMHNEQHTKQRRSCLLWKPNFCIPKYTQLSAASNCTRVTLKY